jgi:hypothetical protein
LNPISCRFSDLSVIKNIIVPSVVIIPAFINFILNSLNRLTPAAQLALQNADRDALQKKLAAAER